MAEDVAGAIKPIPPGFKRNMIIATTLFVALMASIDLTIVTVALPYMAGNLNATADEITWVVTMFAVGQAIIIGITGHLSRLLGRKILVLTSVIGFTLSSVACGLSEDLEMIVFFRFIQGLFSGPLIPLSQAMLMDAVEEKERAKILSFWVIGVMGGPAIGPLLGGYLAQHLDWRWNFWVNVPVGALALMMILQFVRQTVRKPVKTDWFGLLVLSIMLGSLQIALNKGDNLDWFSSSTIVILLLISFTAAIVVVCRGILLGERHIIDITLFADFNFSICCILIATFGSGFLALMILTPQLFVDALGWEPSTAGIVIGCYGVGAVVGSFVAGRLTTILTIRQSFIIACLLFAIGWFWFSRLDQDIGMWQAVPPGVIIEFGMMLAFPLLAARAFAFIPAHKRDEGAGMFNLVKTLGFSFGTTAVGVLYYDGILSNWSRYVGNISNANPALTQYLADMGDNISYETKIAYVAELLDRQAQIQTILQIAETIAVASVVLAFFAIFLGEPKRKTQPA